MPGKQRGKAVKKLLYIMLLAVTKVVANDYLDGRTALFTCEKCVLFVFVDKCHLLNTTRSESVCEM